jgi:hypothetical protein
MMGRWEDGKGKVKKLGNKPPTREGSLSKMCEIWGRMRSEV